MLEENWESCVVVFKNPLEPGSVHQVEVDTINGNACELTSQRLRYRNKPFSTVEVTICSRYIRRGGWLMFNALIQGKECVISEPNDLNGRAVICNAPHNTQKVREA